MYAVNRDWPRKESRRGCEYAPQLAETASVHLLAVLLSAVSIPGPSRVTAYPALTNERIRWQPCPGSYPPPEPASGNWVLGTAWSARAGASFAKRGPGERSDSLKADQRVFKIAGLEGADARAGTLPLLALERSWRGRGRPVAALAFKNDELCKTRQNSNY